VQLELKPVKVEPGSAAAVSVTVLPLLKEPVHVAPQEIPAGLEVTLPVPVPCLETASEYPTAVNVVVTFTSAETVIVHCDGFPETGAQLELKLVNAEFASATAFSVTTVLASN
jgi:hypothetical protein